MVKLVHEGQKVVPTCQECGCRLVVKNLVPSEDHTILWEIGHFPSLVNDITRDARGCVCPLLEEVFTVTDTDISAFYAQ